MSVVELENVWKVFGSRASEAMAAIRAEGLGKAEVLERFEAVVGVTVGVSVAILGRLVGAMVGLVETTDDGLVVGTVVGVICMTAESVNPHNLPK